MIRHIHPFPARMAPELAIAGLRELKQKGIVLDPMVGSGTVLRQASELGHRAIGFDTDPLAVLMTKVWTTPIDIDLITRLTVDVLNRVKTLPQNLNLTWIDEDTETEQFISFWFAEPQRSELRRIAYVLSELKSQYQDESDVLRLALSRIIITKSNGASLARDVSHSRPHKVAEFSNFNVTQSFERSVKQVCKLLSNAPPPGNTRVMRGDARNLTKIEDGEIDAVLTSPPYLNAIDYMRGHRLSLVWLGYKLSDLRYIRSNNIGAERGLEKDKATISSRLIKESMGQVDKLSSRFSRMIARYAVDIYELMFEIARVLKPEGKSILVVGNSCIKGVFIRNSDAVVKAASMVGLNLINQIERELPIQSRYLPMPIDVNSPLGKRMRTETILTFSSI